MMMLLLAGGLLTAHLLAFALFRAAGYADEQLAASPKKVGSRFTRGPSS